MQLAFLGHKTDGASDNGTNEGQPDAREAQERCGRYAKDPTGQRADAESVEWVVGLAAGRHAVVLRRTHRSIIGVGAETARAEGP